MNFKNYLRESLNEQSPPGGGSGIPYYLPLPDYHNWPLQFPGSHDWDGDGIPDDVYLDQNGNLVIVSGATGQVIHRSDDPLYRPDEDPFGNPLYGDPDGEVDEYGWPYWDEPDEDGIITRYTWNPITGEWEYHDTIFPPDWQQNPYDMDPAKLRYLEWLLQQDLNGDGFIPASNPNVVPDSFTPHPDWPNMPWYPDMVPVTPEANIKV